MTDMPEQPDKVQSGAAEEPGGDSDSKRLTPARRKMLVRVGIVVLVLVLFVGVPAYIALQPAFLGNYPNMDAEHEAWETSVHANVNCQSCHIDPGVAQVTYGARMVGEFYLSLLPGDRESEVLDTPSNDACGSCHIDLRTVSPSGDLLIPHAAHVDVLEMECVECHDYVVHEVNPEGTHTPRMITCMECHDGEQAKNACEVCHTEKGAPDSHAEADWLITHPDRQDGEDCIECHGWTEDWCVECHTRRPPSHVDNWRTVHRDSVAERRTCEVCHQGEFCIECHGEVPALNFDPAVTLVE